MVSMPSSWAASVRYEDGNSPKWHVFVLGSRHRVNNTAVVDGDVMIHVPMASGNPNTPWVRLGAFIAAFSKVLMGRIMAFVFEEDRIDSGVSISHAQVESRFSEVS